MVEFLWHTSLFHKNSSWVFNANMASKTKFNSEGNLWHLLNILIPGPHPELLIQKLWGWRVRDTIHIVNKLYGWFGCVAPLNNTALVVLELQCNVACTWGIGGEIPLATICARLLPKCPASPAVCSHWSLNISQAWGEGLNYPSYYRPQNSQNSDLLETQGSRVCMEPENQNTDFSCFSKANGINWLWLYFLNSECQGLSAHSRCAAVCNQMEELTESVGLLLKLICVW